MDYFKHYSTASDSKLINHLFDEYRHTGYAYWFLLLELCAENWDGKSDPSFKFHTRIVRQKLRISLQNLELFLTKCSMFCDIKFKLSKNELEIDIPKLAEVKTSRSVIKSNKKQLTVYIEKDIDTEIEVKPVSRKPRVQKKITTTLFEVEPLQLEEDMSVDQKASNVLTMFNTLTFSALRPVAGNMKHINARLKEGYALEDFKAVITLKHGQWVNNPRMSHCIRPQTFFSENFDSYLQEARNAVKPKIDPLDTFFEKFTQNNNVGA